VHSRQAIRWPERPVPVVLDHRREVSAVVGAVADLTLEPLNGGMALVGRLQLDGPAADQAEPLLRTGAARWSIGARLHRTVQSVGEALTRATDWSIGHLALVVEPQDLAAITRSRSIEIEPMTTTNEAQAVEAIEATETETTERSAKEIRRERDVLRIASDCGITDPSWADQMIASDRTVQEINRAAIKALRIRVEGGDVREEGGPVPIGHPARGSAPATPADSPAGLAGVLHRALRGERQDQPLWLTLRAAGIGQGSDAVSVWRTALSGQGAWLTRGFHSTSDLPSLLTESGNRRLMERFARPETGIRMAAGVRPLADYREASVLDVGLVGAARRIIEGGEITFGSVAESAVKYQPTRHGLGLSFSPESLANDDLNALDLALAELADAMLDAEAAALVDLIEGAADGRTAPDGLALFASDHANSVSAGPLEIGSIGSAVQLLREQKAVGGRYISQDPAVMIVGTEHETTARQLLSDAINAAQSDAVNPWRNLEIAVEPRLSGSYSYILGNSRRPLELGRLTAGPVLTTETQFSTSAYRAKAEHAFGVAVCEHRSIVRIPTAGA
jgi:hypothetical protein